METDQDYLFEQFRVERGCLSYAIASARSAVIIDPELVMVEPMLDYVFGHGLKPAYVIDTHTHADHVSGARELRSKTTAKIVMHEMAPATFPSSSSTRRDTPRASSPSCCQAAS